MNFKFFQKTTTKGFSLLELLAALAIIVILGSLSIVYYMSYVEKTNLGFVESVLRSAYAIVKDNKNFGISTHNIELNEMSTPKEQHNKAKVSNPSTNVGIWLMKLDTSNVTSIPVSSTADWCLQINLGEVAYKDTSSCIDSSGIIAHMGQPLTASKGECSASSQCE